MILVRDPNLSYQLVYLSPSFRRAVDPGGYSVALLKDSAIPSEHYVTIDASIRDILFAVHICDQQSGVLDLLTRIAARS